MESQKADQIIQHLNNLLDTKLSLHSVSFIFHNVAEILVSEGVKIRIVRSKQYYLDPTHTPFKRLLFVRCST
jgi:hypothetical protein